jgi:hypothetical protein
MMLGIFARQLWVVINCRASRADARLKYPRKLPRQSSALHDTFGVCVQCSLPRRMQPLLCVCTINALAPPEISEPRRR